MAAKKNQRFDDGASVNDCRDSGRRIDPHKNAQLCEQIRRTLELTLLGEVRDPVLGELAIDSVTPTADPGRVRVVFLAGAEHAKSTDDLLRRLESARGLFKSAIARAISRRRVPDLSFEVCCDSGDEPYVPVENEHE